MGLCKSSYQLFEFDLLRSRLLFALLLIMTDTVSSSSSSTVTSTSTLLPLELSTALSKIDLLNNEMNENKTLEMKMLEKSDNSSLTDSNHSTNLDLVKRKSRVKRSIIQLAGMIRCVSGCDPFLYKSYGCYCGYLGAGKPVDAIDRCCLEHDWCYTYAACPQILIYFVPYQWSCVTPGYAKCGVVPFGGVTEKCSYQLCQCDRVFAKCLSKYQCPSDKPICQSSPLIALQNIISGR